jgi:hypothetical protein
MYVQYIPCTLVLALQGEKLAYLIFRGLLLLSLQLSISLINNNYELNI